MASTFFENYVHDIRVLQSGSHCMPTPSALLDTVCVCVFGPGVGGAGTAAGVGGVGGAGGVPALIPGAGEMLCKSTLLVT